MAEADSFEDTSSGRHLQNNFELLIIGTATLTAHHALWSVEEYLQKMSGSNPGTFIKQ